MSYNVSYKMIGIDSVRIKLHNEIVCKIINVNVSKIKLQM